MKLIEESLKELTAISLTTSCTEISGIFSPGALWSLWPVHELPICCLTLSCMHGIIGGLNQTMRGGAVAARRAHNPKVAGSSPAPATT